MVFLLHVIIQHIVAMSKYGHSALNIRRAYSTAFFSNKRRKLCFVINVLNNKTITLLNLADYRLILANSAYGRFG